MLKQLSLNEVKNLGLKLIKMKGFIPTSPKNLGKDDNLLKD